MVRINKDEFGEIMEHLYKAKKSIKKACELFEEGEDGSRRGRGMSGRRHDSNRFEDEDYD